MTAILLAAALWLSPYRLEAFGVSAIIGQHFYQTLVSAGYCNRIERLEQMRVIHICRLKNGIKYDAYRESQSH